MRMEIHSGRAGAVSRPGSTVPRQVERVTVDPGQGVRRRVRSDRLATEEPLEIRVAAAADLRGGGVLPGAARPVSVTMRTPGADFELAVGFLFSEGIVERRGQVHAVSYCVEADQRYNVVNVVLSGDPGEALDRVAGRLFAVSSACGVCGAASIQQALGSAPAPVADGPRIPAERLLAMPDALRAAQALFERTGGIHAAALFTPEGELLRLREDVGRHNALDKLVGASLLADELPLSGQVVMVSGRLSFELAQKAARAGVTILAGVSAPSSLAVQVAEAAGMTLAGFVRGKSFNLYAGGHRITGAGSTEGQGA
jgi:FdhD protein